MSDFDVEKIMDVEYPVKGSWYRHNIDPKYAFQRNTGSPGFITNGRGVAFHLHGSTKYRELVKLCAYLDQLEAEKK